MYGRATEEDAVGFAESFAALHDRLQEVVLGKPEQLRLALVTLCAGGHLLVEDVPGVGKTTLARTMAAAVGGSTKRIQCTPDLLPSEISGSMVYTRGEIEFRPGPVFANIVVCDEVNRATPKAQSALLQVMEEGQVTVDGLNRDVPKPFMVVATQNPVDLDSTYPLPEAQLDRFMMRLRLGYPDLSAEINILRTDAQSSLPSDDRPVVALDRLATMIGIARRIHADEHLLGYVARITRSTRDKGNGLGLGASPRAGLALLRAAKVRAAAAGRDYVDAEDVKALAVTVLAHRLLPSDGRDFHSSTDEEAMGRLLSRVPVRG